ncbi:hypothetical protein HDU76_012199 [Blyttiomyces sp. JEL0837]|nr:hypothetical protein HDU76_012199 [Blyttiomyces sp. JEL0837]
MADYLQYAMKFPEAAKWLWDVNVKIQTYLANLTPDARAKVIAAAAWLASFMVTLSKMFLQAYNYIMSLPGTPATDWKPPSPMITRPIANFILYITPFKDDWSLVIGKSAAEEPADPNNVPMDGVLGDENARLIFVANSGLWSLEAMSLVATIYMRTGKLPRRVTDVYHFKIPLWKHLIEYFGAIPSNDTETLSSIMSLGHPILLHPAGRLESFRKSSDPVIPTDSNYNTQIEYINLAIKNKYTILPVTTLGVESMFKILAYERQYLVAASPISTSNGDAEFIKDKVVSSIKVCYEKGKSVQANDEKRNLFEGFWEIFEGGRRTASSMSERFDGSPEVIKRQLESGRKRISSVLQYAAKQLDPDAAVSGNDVK